MSVRQPDAQFARFDPSFLFRPALTIVIAYITVQLFVIHFGKRSLAIFLRVVIATCLAQGMVLWLTYFSPSFRGFMSMFFFRDPDPNRQHLVELRSPGFVASGGDGLSFTHALLCIVAYTAVLHRGKLGHRKLILGLVFLSGLSCFTTGLTGLFLFLAFSLLVTLWHLRRRSGHVLGLLLVTLAATGITLFLGIASGLGRSDGRIAEHPVARLARSFRGSTLDFYLTSTTATPDSWFTLALGGGVGPEETIVQTDQFYYRTVVAVGVFVLILLLGLGFLAPLVRVLRCSGQASRSQIRCWHVSAMPTAAKLASLTLAFGLVGSFKGFMLTSRVSVFIFFVLVGMSCVSVSGGGLVRSNRRNLDLQC